jgi:hypothetical protein
VRLWPIAALAEDASDRVGDTLTLSRSDQRHLRERDPRLRALGGWHGDAGRPLPPRAALVRRSSPARHPTDPLSSQGSLTFDRRRGLLYAVNAGSDTVSVFAVRGTTLRLMQVIASGGPEGIGSSSGSARSFSCILQDAPRGASCFSRLRTGLGVPMHVGQRQMAPDVAQVVAERGQQLPHDRLGLTANGATRGHRTRPA